MTAQHYDKIENEKLKTYIPVDKFRTITYQTRKDIKPTCKELIVDIQLKKPFIKTLDFHISLEGAVYGVVLMNDELKKLSTSKDGSLWVKNISLTDWHDRFLLVMEGEVET